MVFKQVVGNSMALKNGVRRPEGATPGKAQQPTRTLVGLFAGIGGFEEGLRFSGYSSTLMCDVDPLAQRVLAERFPGVPLLDDIRRLGELPAADVVTAGFPCQDLSQAGRTQGIKGSDSGLIDSVFRLLREARKPPRWLILENVPFMLKLDRGRAMSRIVDELEALGWSWAYRTIDTRAFGLPQRRRRVILLASKTDDPRPVLLAQDKGAPPPLTHGNFARGFYWTEGNTGLGWAVDAIPPLKCGSRVGIPSPPAIWFPLRRSILVPSIEDAERLQGFPAGWTNPGSLSPREVRQRWRLVGNAVSVPLSKWLGRRLSSTNSYKGKFDPEALNGASWPDAAWGIPRGDRHRALVSAWPVQHGYQHLAPFLTHHLTPLSVRATGGFLSRILASTLRVDENFVRDLEHHIECHDTTQADHRHVGGRQPSYEAHTRARQRSRESAAFGAS
jgi:DNA (cytosine-5)-methyltransferase 1